MDQGMNRPCGKWPVGKRISLQSDADVYIFIENSYGLVRFGAPARSIPLELQKGSPKSIFFVGNNAGPLNMAAALGVKSFGLISNDPVSELKYSNILAITPDNYTDNVWNRDRKGMKNLTVEKVSNFILEKIQ